VKCKQCNKSVYQRDFSLSTVVPVIFKVKQHKLYELNFLKQRLQRQDCYEGSQHNKTHKISETLFL